MYIYFFKQRTYNMIFTHEDYGIVEILVLQY